MRIMVNCPHCSKENELDSSYCIRCGKGIHMPKNQNRKNISGKICGKCQSAVGPEDKYCCKCGDALKSDAPEDPTWLTEISGPDSAGALVLANVTSGNALEVLHFEKEEIIVGKREGHYQYPEDELMSDQHFLVKKNINGNSASYRLEDLSHAEDGKGVFIRLRPKSPVKLIHQDTFFIGQQHLQFREIDSMGMVRGKTWEIAELAEDDLTVKNRHIVNIGTTTIGRERKFCDISFANDNLCSRTHAKIEYQNGTFCLEDAGSRNGVYIKVRGAELLDFGYEFLAGRQKFRLIPADKVEPIIKKFHP